MRISPKVLKIAFEARFAKPSLLFYDKKSTIGNRLMRKFEHWETDGLITILTKPADKTLAAIEHNRVLVAKEFGGNLTSSSIPEEIIKNVIDSYSKELSLENLDRVGLRTMICVPLKLKFEELVSITKEKFYPKSKELIGIIGNSYKDTALAVVFELGNINNRLQIGPVKKEELLARVQFRFDYQKEILPDVSLFIDFDCFQQNIPTGKADEFITIASENTLSIIEKVAKFTLGTK